MALFLPGNVPLHVIAPCSLCDSPALYVAILKIRVFDQTTNKLVATSIELSVCQAHADKMDVCIDKIVKDDRKQLIIV